MLERVAELVRTRLRVIVVTSRHCEEELFHHRIDLVDDGIAHTILAIPCLGLLFLDVERNFSVLVEVKLTVHELFQSAVEPQTLVSADPQSDNFLLCPAQHLSEIAVLQNCPDQIVFIGKIELLVVVQAEQHGMELSMLLGHRLTLEQCQISASAQAFCKLLRTSVTAGLSSSDVRVRYSLNAASAPMVIRI